MTCEHLYRPSEVAKMLGVEPSTVLRWCKSGALPFVERPTTSTTKSYRLIKASIVEAILNGFIQDVDMKGNYPW